MSTNLQDLLREGLDRLTADASVPDGLVGRAQQHNRRRKTTIRAGIAASTAVAAAAVAVTVSLATTGNKPGSTTVQTQTVADVITRTERALAVAADHGNAIQVTRESTPGVTFGLAAGGPGGLIGSSGPGRRLPGAHAAVLAQHMMTWWYHGLFVEEGFSPAGKLVFVNVFKPVTLRSGKKVTINYGAAYPVRTRWHSVISGQSTAGGTPSCGIIPSGPDWRATIAKALSCGLFRLSGRQYVDGVDAMKLVSRPHTNPPFQSTIWVNPATYLPVRLSVTFQSGLSRGLDRVYDFHFQRPTRANLAALHAAVQHAPIPATFRPLPPADIVIAGPGL